MVLLKFTNLNLSLFLFLFVAVLNTGCSTTPEVHSKTSENITTSKFKKPMLSGQSTYLEQEELLMTDVPLSVIETYNQAILLMQQKKWQKALYLLDEVIEKHDNLSGSYINKALIFNKLSLEQTEVKVQLKHFNKSKSLINKAIKVNPFNPYAQYVRGQIFASNGQFQHAEESYAAALSIWPNYPKAQLSMAVLLELFRGKLIEAYQHYSAYLLIESDDKKVKQWHAALAIKIKRSGLSIPVQ